VAAVLIDAYSEGNIDSIQVIYTRFVSLGSQSVTRRQLIPLQDQDGPEGEEPTGTVVYEYEPDAEEIVERLLPSWVEAEVLAALLEAAASEQASRQRAMKAATDNADDLITRLTRVMNRARQDAITTEIMEIVGGAEALRQSASARAE
jgi:F-type H+-transporting ATPase subunit gamma